MVIATQNPAHHGTYPLPESQLDRFLMRIDVGYPGGVARARSCCWDATRRDLLADLPTAITPQNCCACRAP